MNETESEAAVELYKPMEVSELQEQILLIQKVMKATMKKDEHYGVIPGCGGGKPTLLKAGAEKLAFVFRMAPSFEINRDDFRGGHRGYEVTCTLKHIDSGKFLGQGVGYCSSMEGKYRFRYENTDKPVPPEYWDSRDIEELGGEGYTKKKVDGKWVIMRRVENENPADVFNTILKMAAKRAQVAATLTATAASDIFTQDIEDMDLGDDKSKDNGNGHKETPSSKTVVHESTGKKDYKDPTEWNNENGVSDKRINWLVKDAKKNKFYVPDIEKWIDKSMSEISVDDWRSLMGEFSDADIK